MYIQFTDRHGVEIWQKLLKLANYDESIVKRAMDNSAKERNGSALLSDVVDKIVEQNNW